MVDPVPGRRYSTRVNQEVAVPITSALTVELERELDGRWIADIVAMPGVLAYGSTPGEARAYAEALALRVVAERNEHSESVPERIGVLEPNGSHGS